MSEALISDFRAHGGQVTSGPFTGRAVLLLTTTGAHSGRRRLAPLVYTREGEHCVIVASKGGSPTHPAWYHNLIANPLVTVEAGGETFEARARVTEGAERDRLFAQHAAINPGFTEYQRRTTRVIPVVVLERESGPEPRGGGARMNPILASYLAAEYFGDYQALRDQLMDIVSDDDLACRVGGTSASLGALCREIGEIEHSYVESFRTFRQDFGYRHPDPRIETSVAALRAWYAELDRDLLAALETLSEEDMTSRRIARGDFDEGYFSPLPTEQLDVYREALLIFYGKASVYLRAMGTTLPPQWQAWIG